MPYVRSITSRCIACLNNIYPLPLHIMAREHPGTHGDQWSPRRWCNSASIIHTFFIGEKTRPASCPTPLLKVASRCCEWQHRCFSCTLLGLLSLGMLICVVHRVGSTGGNKLGNRYRIGAAATQPYSRNAISWEYMVL